MQSKEEFKKGKKYQDELTKANQGDKDAQYYLGCYFDGYGEFKEASEWYEKAAHNDHPEALYSIGMYYLKGKVKLRDLDQDIIIDKDEVKATTYLQLAGLQGHVEAQYRLGLYFEEKAGGVNDAKMAVSFYQDAALKKNDKAQYRLGCCLEQGIGIDKDVKAAVNYYRLAAEQGNVEAQYKLGYCFQHGIGVAQDMKQALHLYRSSADKQYAAAQHQLGYCFENGIGVSKDEKEAVRLYTLAANQKYAKAQFSLGLCYENGIGIAAKNLKDAVYNYYILAAAQEHPEAINKLGKFHNIYPEALGSGPPISDWRYFKLAAERGSAAAAYNFAQCLANGRSDLAKDQKEAKRLVRIAADKGYVKAQLKLGLDYNLAKDYSQAKRWFELAAGQGNAAARYYMALYYEKGKGVPKDEGKAVYHYKIAAEQGNAKAQNTLGVLYTNGVGVNKDMMEAIRWYKAAADQGHPHAKSNLSHCYKHGLDMQTTAPAQTALPLQPTTNKSDDFKLSGNPITKKQQVAGKRKTQSSTPVSLNENPFVPASDWQINTGTKRVASQQSASPSPSVLSGPMSFYSLRSATAPSLSTDRSRNIGMSSPPLGSGDGQDQTNLKMTPPSP